MLDTLSILLPATVLKNCLEAPGLKPFSTSCTKWSCPVIVQLKSFLIETPWSSSLTVFLSFEDLLPHLTFTCLCFACGTVPLVFICDYRKCRRLSEPYFLSPCWSTHVLQFSSGTFPLNFFLTVTQCSFINNKPLYCFLLFHTLPFFSVDCGTFLPPFFWVELSLFLVWVSQKYPVCPFPCL